MMRRIAIAMPLLVSLQALAEPPNRNDPDMTGKRELQMMQCPSAAPGAVTTVKTSKEGVELLVTAPTDWGRREVRRRAQQQQAMASQPARGHEEHTGQGTGSGLYGFCPGMMQGTKLTATDTDDGVRIVVVAGRRDQVAELQRTTRARAARLAASMAAAKR
jgi:hypothetical protein